ncbi:MAG: hypothetical protein ACYCPW_03795 [Nitrososphaerales archaeon]
MANKKFVAIATTKEKYQSPRSRVIANAAVTQSKDSVLGRVAKSLKEAAINLTGLPSSTVDEPETQIDASDKPQNGKLAQLTDSSYNGTSSAPLAVGVRQASRDADATTNPHPVQDAGNSIRGGLSVYKSSEA